MGVVRPTRFGFDIACFVIASFCTVRNTHRLSRAKGQPRNIENRQQTGLERFNSPNAWGLSVARLVRLNTTCLGRWPRHALHQHLRLLQVHLAIANLVLSNAPVHDWISFATFP